MPGVNSDMSATTDLTRLSEEMQLLEHELKALNDREDRKVKVSNERIHACMHTPPPFPLSHLCCVLHQQVRMADLGEAMRVLGKKCSKRELSDMIWEVKRTRSRADVDAFAPVRLHAYKFAGG